MELNQISALDSARRAVYRGILLGPVRGILLGSGGSWWFFVETVMVPKSFSHSLHLLLIISMPSSPFSFFFKQNNNLIFLSTSVCCPLII